MKILVCDDIENRGRRTLKEIAAAERGHETELLSDDALKEAIRRLFDRAEAVLKNPESATDENDKWEFNADFDLAILDNNLSALRVAGARHTAESIAGYVRAFGDIPYIVSLNKNPQVDFDLRYLVGDYQTHADVALNERHLSNRALWTGDPKHAKEDFLPWYWPALNNAAKRRRGQIEFVAEHLDQPILSSMAFPAAASHELSPHARGALSPDAVRASSITFMKFFVTACRSLPIRADRVKLAKAASASDAARAVVARVVAGEVDRWVRCDLLGPQDLLVDVPHLLMRMPFLLDRHANEPERWNDAVMATERPYGLSGDIYRDHLQAARFPHDVWTKSPCFWWRKLKSDRELNQLFFGDESQWAEVFFCEDLSRFEPRDSGKGLGAMAFTAEFEGAWTRRHVAHLKGKHYTPMSRLAK